MYPFFLMKENGLSKEGLLPKPVQERTFKNRSRHAPLEISRDPYGCLFGGGQMWSGSGCSTFSQHVGKTREKKPFPPKIRIVLIEQTKSGNFEKKSVFDENLQLPRATQSSDTISWRYFHTSFFTSRRDSLKILGLPVTLGLDFLGQKWTRYVRYRT